MSRGSITISENHGLNPTIPVCFYCGEEKNEIALLGRIGGKKDIEAPRHMILNYEPCDKCKENFQGRVVFMGCVEQPMSNSQPYLEVNDNGVMRREYPTGMWFTINADDIGVILEDATDEVIEEIRRTGRVLCENHLVEEFINENMIAAGLGEEIHRKELK